MNRKILVASAAAFVMATAVAFAHEDAVGVVKERMDAMSNMGKAMKTISLMIRGNSPLDADMIRTSANTILEHSGKSLTKLFPENSNDQPSQVRDEIWSNWEEFNTLAERLNKLAKGMEIAAGNDLMMAGGSMMGKGGMMRGNTHMPSPEMLASMPIDGIFNMVAQTCSACHKQFRIKKK